MLLSLHFLQPPTFHLHCPWLSRWLSITSKRKVCGAADNTLFPQAPAGFSRAPTQSLDWQVWPLLCLVGNCLCCCCFADVTGVFFLLQYISLQFLLFRWAPGLNVHLNCIVASQHAFVLLALEMMKGICNLLVFSYWDYSDLLHRSLFCFCTNLLTFIRVVFSFYIYIAGILIRIFDPDVMLKYSELISVMAYRFYLGHVLCVMPLVLSNRIRNGFPSFWWFSVFWGWVILSQPLHPLYHLFLHSVTSFRGLDQSYMHVYFKVQVLNM